MKSSAMNFKNMKYLWHKRPCKLLIKPDFKKGHIRNCKIRFSDGTETIVPFRALRRKKSTITMWDMASAVNRILTLKEFQEHEKAIIEMIEKNARLKRRRKKLLRRKDGKK